MELTPGIIQKLASTFLTGFIRGQAVDKLKIQVTRETDFAPLTADLISEDTHTALLNLFSSTNGPAQTLDTLDQLIDANEAVLEPVRDYFFDLLMLNLIVTSSEEHGEEYLDSKEWLEMEEASLDRGTELLNLLIYLRDCKENGLKPTLEDFLNEFLLVSDDQFQDEFFIYEDLIRQQALIEGRDEEIFAAGKNVSSEELEEVFVPFLLFFKHMGGTHPATVVRILNLSPHKGIAAGLFQMLQQYYLMEVAVEN